MVLRGNVSNHDDCFSLFIYYSNGKTNFLNSFLEIERQFVCYRKTTLRLPAQYASLDCTHEPSFNPGFSTISIKSHTHTCHYRMLARLVWKKTNVYKSASHGAYVEVQKTF